MKVILRTTAALLALSTLTLMTGCQVGCIEDGSGTHCSAKSLERYDGTPSPVQPLDRTAGAPVTIDVLYGNVLVQRSGSGRVEAQFFPFAYAGYDERPLALQQLAQNLRTSATAAGAVNVSVTRAGGTNGLGADTVVRLPDDFDGAITVINRGGGPLNNFDLKLEFVGRASALSVTNQSLLGNCWVQGSPSVRSTSVQCGERISVFDVSDEVNITNTETSHDEQVPAITLRMAAITPSSRGGKVSSASGAIAATFPSAGGYVLRASSPVKGMVEEGAMPTNCTKQETSANVKTITCGSGPAYDLVAGATPDYVGPPLDSNVLIAYQ